MDFNRFNLEWKYSYNKPIDYNDSLKDMEKTVQNIILKNSPEQVWLLEHPSLYTAGTSSKSSEISNSYNLPVYKTGRGGKYTYHGPGMRIIYIMLNLKLNKEKNDIRKFIFNLEEVIIKSLKYFAIKGERRKDRIGIWVALPNQAEAKIAAIGVRIRKWVSFHGISVNISPDLTYFNGIIPCGIKEYGVTSFSDLGIKNVTQKNFDAVFKSNFLQIFV